MPLLQWSPRFSVWIQDLDEEHRDLFSHINDLWVCIEQNFEKQKLAEAIERTTAAMKAHFSHEESLLQQWGYPQAAQHAQEHQQLLVRLKSLSSMVERTDPAAINSDSIDFIGEWLCNHILKSDFRYASFKLGNGLSKAGGFGLPFASFNLFATRIRRSTIVGSALVIIVLAVNLFMVGLLSYALGETKVQRESEARSTVENTALLIDRSISEWSKRIDLSLREIADRLADDLRRTGTLDRARVNALLAQRKSWAPDMATFRLADASGVLQYGPDVDPEKNISISDRSYFIFHRENSSSELIVSAPFFGRVTRTWVISFSRRYERPDGSFAGVISATVPVSQFTSLLSGLELGPNAIALLSDQNANLISSYPANSSLGFGSPSLSKAFADCIKADAMAQSFLGALSEDGIERLNAYRRLTAVPFHLFVGIDREGWLLAWQADVKKAGAFAILFFALSVTAGLVIWRSFVIAERANNSIALMREIARTKQQLSEAQRIAGLGFIEVDPVSGLWHVGDGTQEMLGLEPTLAAAPAEIILAKVEQTDRDQLLERIAKLNEGSFHRELHLGTTILQAVGEQIGTAVTPSQIVITLQDITQRHAAEKERAAMMARISEANRLESLGTLAGGVAHEINTPAQYIGDNLAFIADWIPVLLDLAKEAREAVASGDYTSLNKKAEALRYAFLSNELPAATAQALTGIERISSIVDAIKAFAYPSTKEPQPFDLNKAVELAAVITRNQWKYVAELKLDLTPNLPRLTGLEGEISQVLVNLIVNAAQAIAEKHKGELGQILVQTRLDEDVIEIAVQDNGGGIPEENLSRLFDLFFTTKPPGQGTGQGLAITNSIVIRHGGKMAVESDFGDGACFRIQLPISAKGAAVSADLKSG